MSRRPGPFETGFWSVHASCTTLSAQTGAPKLESWVPEHSSGRPYVYLAALEAEIKVKTMGGCGPLPRDPPVNRDQKKNKQAPCIQLGQGPVRTALVVRILLGWSVGKSFQNKAGGLRGGSHPTVNSGRGVGAPQNKAGIWEAAAPQETPSLPPFSISAVRGC